MVWGDNSAQARRCQVKCTVYSPARAAGPRPRAQRESMAVRLRTEQQLISLFSDDRPPAVRGNALAPAESGGAVQPGSGLQGTDGPEHHAVVVRRSRRRNSLVQQTGPEPAAPGARSDQEPAELGHSRIRRDDCRAPDELVTSFSQPQTLARRATESERGERPGHVRFEGDVETVFAGVYRSVQRDHSPQVTRPKIGAHGMSGGERHKCELRAGPPHYPATRWPVTSRCNSGRHT